MDEYETIVSRLTNYTCLAVQAMSAKPQVERFCGLYNVKLTRILPTRENGRFEPMYVFNDNSGGYTLEGLVKSIEGH